jgi:hypothetical protein
MRLMHKAWSGRIPKKKRDKKYMKEKKDKSRILVFFFGSGSIPEIVFLKTRGLYRIKLCYVFKASGS